MRIEAPRRQRLFMPLILLAVAAPLRAETTPYYFGGSQTFTQESNLLRLADGATLQAGQSRGDTLSSTALLAGFNQPFGRQRGYTNVALRSTRLSKNPVYNNLGYTLTGGLDWSTVSQISGSLSASATRALSINLQEVGLLQRKNLESTQTADASVRMGIGAQTAVELGRGHRQVGNTLDLAAVQAREFAQDTTSVGLRWRPGGVSAYGLFVRDTRGRYPKFRSAPTGYEADRFKRQDLDLSAYLAATGASALDLKLSWGKTRYDLNDQRDFSGATGALGWTWQASGKLRVETRLSRDVGQDSYAVTVFNTPGSADYSRLTDTLRLKFDYDATAKLALNVTLSQAERQIVRTIENPFVPLGTNGRERDRLYSLGLRWVPTRASLFGCDYLADRRRGNGPLVVNLDANTFSCYGQLTLQ